MKKKASFFFLSLLSLKLSFSLPLSLENSRRPPPNKLTVEVREPLGDLRAPSRGVLVRVVTLDGSHGRMLLRRRWSRARGGGARRGMLLLLRRRRRRSQARPLRLRLRCHDPLERAPTDEGLHNVAVFVYQRSSFFLGGVGEVVNVFLEREGGWGSRKVEFAAAARRTSRGSRGSILPPLWRQSPPNPESKISPLPLVDWLAPTPMYLVMYLWLRPRSTRASCARSTASSADPRRRRLTATLVGSVPAGEPWGVYSATSTVFF